MPCKYKCKHKEFIEEYQAVAILKRQTCVGISRKLNIEYNPKDLNLPFGYRYCNNCEIYIIAPPQQCKSKSKFFYKCPCCGMLTRARKMCHYSTERNNRHNNNNNNNKPTGRIRLTKSISNEIFLNKDKWENAIKIGVK